MQAVWPMSPTASYFSPHLQAGLPPSIQYTTKPRVGLGVICMCQPQKYGVECLLLKRGPKFVSPLKWSFPGGRLDEEGDLEDDGERGTLRELKKECGGGAPHGLPPLIHIECYKSGKTLYHVYVLDTESQTSWLRWQPSKTLEHTGEIDATARELLLQGRSFPAYNGFCWVDLQSLIEECLAININDTDAVSSHQLQHGLIRWVRTNGENILKTLLARSPNLAYQRRYSSSSSSSSSLPPPRGVGGIPSNRIQLTPNRWLHPSLDMPRPPLLPSAGVYQYPVGTTGTGEFPQSGGTGGEQQQLQMLLNQLPLVQQQQLLTEANLVRTDTSTVSTTSVESSGSAGPYDSAFQPSDSAPLITTPPFDVSGGGGSPRKPHPRRYELCRNYIISGQCPFGDKCWFVHPDGKSRDPIMSGATPPISPLQQMWHPSGYLMDQLMPHPQTGNSAVTPSFQFSHGNRPGFLPMVRPGFPTQPGGGATAAMMFRPYIFPGQFFNRQGAGPIPGFGPTGFPPQHFVQSVTDPVLRFKLLSELQVAGNGSCLNEATQLSVRADHFYLSLDETLRDYRILFGGDRTFSDSSSLTAEQSFSSRVTCLHSSKMQSLLVVVGCEDGSIYCWDPRKSNSTTPQLTVIHEANSSKSESPVTALIHFSTTIEGAQVVVSGHADGSMAWYIAQPPMKIFSLLSSANTHSPYKVVSLQIFGGCLISGSSNGTVCLWNMRSQEPTLADRVQAHTKSLLDIYVLDASSFLTVGHNVVTLDPATGDLAAPTDTPPNDEIETLTTNMTSVSLLPNPPSSSSSPSSTSNNYSASIWEYTKSSVTNTKTVDHLGDVLVTAFHQQPMFGNQFLALGFHGGAVKIYNLPSFSVASEIHFPDIATHSCRHVALNLSREKENTHHFNMRNPFRDLILTTVWTDGRVMICQIEPMYKGGGAMSGGGALGNTTN